LYNNNDKYLDQNNAGEKAPTLLRVLHNTGLLKAVSLILLKVSWKLLHAK
jgi:hypothetical protein